MSGASGTPELVGQVLDGKYRVEERLGEGGMGAVYRATHLGTGRTVALKVIAPELTADEDAARRFQREARAAGRLRHPNVVDVTDFGFAAVGELRVAFLVMEHLRGATLADLLELSPRPPLPQVLQILDQIGQAVDEAHRHGIIHRDLKPANIWLTPDGRGGYLVKVLDFGIAKLREAAPAEPAAAAVPEAAPIAPRPATRREIEAAQTLPALAPPAAAATGAAAALTVPGALLGTPLYMSPEQWLGQEPSPRADIYSLGVILHEMLAGEPPFRGDIDALREQHLHAAPPPLRARRPDLPRALVTLARSMLAKDPAARPGTCATVAAGLRVHGEGAPAMLRRALEIYVTERRAIVGAALLWQSPLFAVGLASLGVQISERWGLRVHELPLLTLLQQISLLLASLTRDLLTAALSLLVVRSLVPAPAPASAIRADLRRVSRVIVPSLLVFACVQAFVLLLGALGDAAGLRASRLPAALLGLLESLIIAVVTARFVLYPAIAAVEGAGAVRSLARSLSLSARAPAAVVQLVVLWQLVLQAAIYLLNVISADVTGLRLGLNLHFEHLALNLELSLFNWLLTALLLVAVLPFFPVALGLLYVRLREAGGEAVAVAPAASDAAGVEHEVMTVGDLTGPGDR